MSLNNDFNQLDPTKLPADNSSSGLPDKASLEKVGTPKEMPPTGQTEKKSPTTDSSALESKQTSGSIGGKLSKLLSSLPTGDQVKNFFGGVLGGLASAGKALGHLASTAKKNMGANTDIQSQTKTVLNPLFKKNETSKTETPSQAPARPPRPLLDAVRSGDVGAVKTLIASGKTDTVRDLNAAKAAVNQMTDATKKGEMLNALKRDLPEPPVKSDASPTAAPTKTGTTTPQKPPRPLLDAVKRGDVETVKTLMKGDRTTGMIKHDLKVAPGFARQLGDKSSEMLAALNIREMPGPPPPPQDDEPARPTKPLPKTPQQLKPLPKEPRFGEAMPSGPKAFNASSFYDNFSNTTDSAARTKMLSNLRPEQKVALKNEVNNRQATLKDELSKGSQDITFTDDLMTLAKNKVEIENTLREFESQAGNTVFKPGNTPPPPTPTNSPSSSPQARGDITESLENVLGGAFTAVKSTPSPKSRLSQGPESLSKQEKKELSAKLEELKDVKSQDELRTKLEAITQPEQRKALLDKAIEDLTALTLTKGTQAEKNALSKLITNMGLLISPSGEFLTSPETVAQNLQLLGQIPISQLTDRNEILAARLLSKMSDAPAGFASTYQEQGSFSSDQLLLTYSDYFSATELFNGMAAVLSANAPDALQETSANQKLAVLDFAERWIATNDNAADNEALKTALLRGQESTDPRVKEAAQNVTNKLSAKIASQTPAAQTAPSGSMNQEVQQSFDAVLSMATDSAPYKESVASWCKDISRTIAGFKSTITSNDLFVGSKNIDKNYGTANTTAAITRINLLSAQFNDMLVRAANPNEGGSPEKYITARAFFLDMALQFEQSNDLEALQAMQGVIESSDSTALNNLYVRNSNSSAVRNLDKKEAKYDQTCKTLLDKTKNFKNLRARSNDQGVPLPLGMVMRDLFGIRNNEKFNSNQENTQIADTQVPLAELPNPTRINLSHDTAQVAASLLSKQQRLAREPLETPIGRALKGASLQPRNDNERYAVIKELKAAAAANENTE